MRGRRGRRGKRGKRGGKREGGVRDKCTDELGNRKKSTRGKITPADEQAPPTTRLARFCQPRLLIDLLLQ